MLGVQYNPKIEDHMEKPISLDGIRMRVVSTAEGGEIPKHYLNLLKTVWLSLRDMPVDRFGLAI